MNKISNPKDRTLTTKLCHEFC